MTRQDLGHVEAGLANAPSGVVLLAESVLRAAAWRASTEWIDERRGEDFRALDVRRLAEVGGGAEVLDRRCELQDRFGVVERELRLRAWPPAAAELLDRRRSSASTCWLLGLAERA